MRLAMVSFVSPVKKIISPNGSCSKKHYKKGNIYEVLITFSKNLTSNDLIYLFNVLCICSTSSLHVCWTDPRLRDFREGFMLGNASCISWVDRQICAGHRDTYPNRSGTKVNQICFNADFMTVSLVVISGPHSHQPPGEQKFLYLSAFSGFLLGLRHHHPQTLVQKLSFLGWSPTLGNWILDFLSNRPQTVRISTTLSPPPSPSALAHPRAACWAPSCQNSTCCSSWVEMTTSVTLPGLHRRHLSSLLGQPRS